MRITNLKKIEPKDLIVFDLDGTLTPSKAPMDTEMANLVRQLLETKKVAIIGGGKYHLFRTLFLDQLRAQKSLLERLFLFPTTATAFYRYRFGWKMIYALRLSHAEKKRIKKAFQDILRKVGYRHPGKVYGKVLEDRGTQMTFSALGQEVVALLGKKRGVALKEQWLRENCDTKMKITKLLSKILPNFEVRAAGFTSIDVTRKGIDKAYGLRQIRKYLHVEIKNMLFIGDAIFPGGNDYPIVKTGVDYIAVRDCEQTKGIIRVLLEQK
ncbi:MAG: HAD-IIB family hydrolase [Candidatus Sungiibacteriota bacterium]